VLYLVVGGKGFFPFSSAFFDNKSGFLLRGVLEIVSNKAWNGLPLVIYGTGGISVETALTVREINRLNPSPVFDFLGYAEDDAQKAGLVFAGKGVVTSSDTLAEFAGGFPLLGVAIPQGFPRVKKAIFEKIKDLAPNLVFPNIIHPSATVNLENTRLGVGNVVAAGVRFTDYIQVGDFNLFNLNVVVGHDVSFGDFCAINPQASISGGTKVEDEVFVGASATVLQHLTLFAKCTIGAGALVTRDVEPGVTVVALPLPKHFS